LDSGDAVAFDDDVETRASLVAQAVDDSCTAKDGSRRGAARPGFDWQGRLLQGADGAIVDNLR